MKNRDLARRNEALVQEDERVRGWLDNVSCLTSEPLRRGRIKEEGIMKETP